MLIWLAALFGERKEYFLRLYDSARFPRAIFDRFRERCDRDGEPWIDVLRRLMEQHAERRTETDQTTRS